MRPIKNPVGSPTPVPLLLNKPTPLVQMAGESSKYLFLFLLSQLLIICSSEVSSIDEFGQWKHRQEGEQILRIPSHRHLLNHLKLTLRDADFPVTPVDTPGAQTPTVVTVPATVSPVTVTPTNPAMTPVPIPALTPVILPPPTAPVNPPVPVTVPVPVTNPVTTYPSPPIFPGTTPGTVPVAPPAISNAPAVPGQSWCIAKPGTTELALQAALDYACGIGGADCSQIQFGASCYNPNTLQNHASYAFNSYYQRNPTAASCDFGGTAAVVGTNPSSGSCIFLTWSPTATPVTTVPTTTPVVPTTTPVVPTPTPSTESSSSSTPAVPVSSAGTPPAALNTGNPAGVFGYGTPPPPFTTTSMSMSTRVQSHLSGISILSVILFAAQMMLER